MVTAPLGVYNECIAASDKAVKLWVNPDKQVKEFTISDLHLLLLHTYVSAIGVKSDFRLFHPQFDGNINSFAMDEFRRRGREKDYANLPAHDNQILYFILAVTISDANFVANGTPNPEIKADYNFAIWNAINRAHGGWRTCFGFDLIGKMPKKPNFLTWWKDIDWLSAE